MQILTTDTAIAKEKGSCRPRNYSSAELMKRVFSIDVLECPRCGGTLRIIGFIDNPAVIEKILRHLKLWNPPTRPPPPRVSVTLETDADSLAWEAAGRLFDGID